MELLHQHNISAVVRGALAQGLLAGKPAKALFRAQQRRSREKIAASINHSSHEAVNYVLKNPRSPPQ